MNIVLDNMLQFYSERNQIMVRQLAIILSSPDHESAVNAAKQAFAELAEHYDPFAPVEVVQASNKEEAA